MESLVHKTKDEFGESLMVKLGALPKGEKESLEAQFYVVLTPGPSRNATVAGVKFIRGAEKLRPLQAALKNAPYHLTFPDETPMKIIRRVIVTCLNGECSMVMLPPEEITSID